MISSFFLLFFTGLKPNFQKLKLDFLHCCHLYTRACGTTPMHILFLNTVLIPAWVLPDVGYCVASSTYPAEVSSSTEKRNFHMEISYKKLFEKLMKSWDNEKESPEEPSVCCKGEIQLIGCHTFCASCIWYTDWKSNYDIKRDVTLPLNKYHFLSSFSLIVPMSRFTVCVEWRFRFKCCVMLCQIIYLLRDWEFAIPSQSWLKV